VEEQLKTINSR